MTSHSTALRRLRGKGCRFVVAGRKDPRTSRFLTLADVDMPPELADLEWQLVEAPRKPTADELHALADGRFADIRKAWEADGINP